MNDAETGAEAERAPFALREIDLDVSKGQSSILCRAQRSCRPARVHCWAGWYRENGSHVRHDQRAPTDQGNYDLWWEGQLRSVAMSG